MKKIIALFLCLSILTAIMPVNAFAADDKGMESVLSIVKARISIPDTYTQFTYSVDAYNGKTTWNFNWSQKNASSENNISVTSDAAGNILNYYKYTPYDGSKKSLPKIDEQTAKAKADEFINRVYPDIFSKIKYTGNSQDTAINGSYSFSYTRVENGIPVYYNSVYVSVDSGLGDVSSYSCNWTDGLVFPDASKAISVSAAQSAYEKNIGLKLVYSWNQNVDDPKVFLEYIPAYNNDYIDATTGERIDLNGDIYGGGGGGDGGYNNGKDVQSSASSGVALTPEELKAVEEVSKLISQDSAQNIARGYTELGITSDYSLTSASLSKSWDINNGYTWNLSFDKPNADTSKEVTYIFVSINAKTGEIRNFSRYFPHSDSETASYDQAASKAAVDAFLKGFMPDKFSSLAFDEASAQSYDNSSAKQYYFTYYRTVNGINFISNPVSISFDAINGKITSLSTNWYDDISFPSAANVISVDGIYQEMFSQATMELQYRFDYSNNGKTVVAYNSIPDVKLVYDVKSDNPISFDANTGKVISSDGKPYDISKAPVYTDISGNFAEKKISVLASNGIYLTGSEFRPNDNITQLDFFKLLIKTMNYYGAISDDSDSIDAMYDYLINSGVIKQSEKAPNSYFSRLDAVKYLVRAMKFGDVAGIKGIFIYPFKDADQLSADDIGYIAIAKGLNIVNGYEGNFAPNDKLTRAEAAVMIYNYLQR